MVGHWALKAAVSKSFFLLTYFGQFLDFSSPYPVQFLDPNPVPPPVAEPVAVHKPDGPHHRMDIAASVGMSRPMFALVFVIISGLSLPLGAVLGILCSPVDDKLVGAMMAFGAGALLFAVTVELYAHTLHEVRKETLGMWEMYTQIVGTIIGAAFYISINKWLEDYLVSGAKSSGHDEEKAIGATASVGYGAAGESSTETPSGRRTSVETPKELGAKGFAQLGRRHTMTMGGTAEGFAQEDAVTKKELLTALHESMDKAQARKEKLTRLKGREKALQIMKEAAPEDHQHAKSVALALFLGLLVDGVPEGVLMGFLSAEGHLTPVMIVSLFVANFPEAFSSASLFIEAEMSKGMIIGMWSGLCLLTGCLGGASCFLLLYFFPTYGTPHEEELPMTVLLVLSLVEGITGGAMLACISSVMLPEAFERTGKGKEGNFWRQSGFLCVMGFLLSVALTAFFG